MWNFIVFALLLVIALFGGILIFEYEDYKPVDLEDYSIRLLKIVFFFIVPLGLIVWNFLA